MSQDIEPPLEGETPLNEADMAADPLDQFRAWLDAARAADIIEPTAMTLATATAGGVPSARLVLLKGLDADGFVFFTNYDSRKGREIDENPRAALVLWWPPLHRQVRIEGPLQRVTDAESDAYHATRDRGKQLAAWISPQSRAVRRADLERDYVALAQRYAGQSVPRPPFWGGYRLRPEVIEFWQGRSNRLHDRLCYRRHAGGSWLLERLAP